MRSQKFYITLSDHYIKMMIVTFLFLGLCEHMHKQIINAKQIRKAWEVIEVYSNTNSSLVIVNNTMKESFEGSL